MAEYGNEYKTEVEFAVYLSSAQKQTGRAILFDVEGGDAQVVVLKSINGVGKSFLLNRIRRELEVKGAIIIDDEFGVMGQIKQREGVGCLVAPILEKNWNLIEKIKKQNLKIKTHLLKGMNEAETSRFVRQLNSGQNTDISIEQIVKYSLGIPYLARMLSLRGLDEDLAVKMVASYIMDNSFFGSSNRIGDIEKYLNMPIPAEVLKVYKDFDEMDKTTKGLLVGILQRWQKLKEKGIEEESPFFVAPQSGEVYDTMLSRAEAPEIDIYAPNLSTEDMEALYKSFGRHDNSGFPNTTQRLNMFGGSLRKVHIEASGQLGLVAPTEFPEKYVKIDMFQGEINSGKILKKMSDQKGEDWFYFHLHEHEGLNRTLVLTGWAVESFLQQRGIAYAVKNPCYGRDYLFDPKTKQLEFTDLFKEER